MSIYSWPPEQRTKGAKNVFAIDRHCLVIILSFSCSCLSDDSIWSSVCIVMIWLIVNHLRIFTFIMTDGLNRRLKSVLSQVLIQIRIVHLVVKWIFLLPRSQLSPTSWRRDVSAELKYWWRGEMQFNRYLVISPKLLSGNFLRSFLCWAVHLWGGKNVCDYFNGFIGGSLHWYMRITEWFNCLVEIYVIKRAGMLNG